MSITAELARLVAIECLSPTAANLSSNGFPTLARKRVFDSRKPHIDDVDRDEDYTPTLSLFTRKTEMARRGTGQGSGSRNGRTLIEVIAELAVTATEDNVEFVDALAADDPQARIVLAGLCAQVRFVLANGPAGALFRRIVIAIDGIEEEGFAVPELGLRWHRTTMLFDCQIPDDDFRPGGGLPEPAATIAALLPAESYARSTLDRIAAQFAAAAPLPKLETIAFETKNAGVSGQIGTAGSVAPPFSDIED